MSPFIETIRLQDGKLINLSYHQERFERTRHLELGLESHPDLYQLIKSHLKGVQGLCKCRILYGKDIGHIEIGPYSRREVKSLKVVKADHVSYGFKYFNRRALEALYEQRGLCDDILMVKNGCVSDSYFANTAFWNGKDWFTPDTPLLPGTMRAALLAKGLLKMARITPGNINSYQKIRLINAMNNLQEGAEIDVNSVEY